MAKKDFKGGLDSLLQNTVNPDKNLVQKTISEPISNKPSEIRATFIVREDYLEKMKAVAYWDRLLVKDVINTAIGEYLHRYGNVKAIPTKK
jgi:hypothetical protein